MKKPTTLRTLIFVLALLFNLASYAQNEIAFNSKLSSGSNENFFLKANNSENRFSFDLDAATSKTSAAPLTNPVIPYAQLPYAGQVTQCPNDGKLLPKLFLCGGNDSRLIDTKITDAQSIIWERFASGGGCVAVSNSDCANEAADASCWNQVGTGQDYLANVAGQFRVKIIDNTGTPYIFYFNVYQNTLIPTATTKSDIIRNSAGNCQISGKITVGGFGAGYQYSFTTTGTSGAWQDSNIFTTNTPGNYTAYIRIKGVVGSCEFKVINLDIKNVSFAVTTSIASPKCSGATGSVQVITNDIKQEYTYTIYNGTNTSGAFLNKVGPTEDATTTFTGLLPGTYTILTSIKGSTCAPEKNTITIANAPNPITSGASITQALGVCNSGQITITRGGGTAPYKFFVNTNGAGFQENPTNIIVVTQPGSYVIRVEDANGCSSASNVTVNVPAVTKPIYQINKVDGDCLGNVGKISLNVSNNNTYNLIQYSIDNGVNFSSSTTVFNIPNPGSYRVVVRYRKNVSGNEAFCTEPASIITVGPSVALTASAGVGELSGCGPVGKELYGLVRIINPQGGTPFPGAFPYKYSFDGKQTWVDNNTEYMNYGGPYTVYIKDAVGCEYPMGGITIDKKPDPPTIKILDPVFNCDGSATTTVTVTNSGTGDPKYSYDYYMDGVLNTSVPTNVFKNVTQGDHTVTVKYNVLKVSTYSNLLQEDFGKGGFTTTPGINPAYCYEDEAFTHLLPGYSCNRDEWINDGEYAVASKIRTRFNNSWIVAKDHTTPADPLGRFLVVNVGGTAGIGGILYSKPIKDVIENQDVIISLWAENLIVKTSTTHDDPKLTIQLVNNLNGVGGTETIVATTDTSNPWVVPKSEKWEYKELLLNPGAYKNLSFVIRSYSNQFNGNDVLIDDIWVRQIPKSCNTVADFPIYVDGSKAFSAGITGFKNILCNGEQNGEITLSAKNFDPTKGFQYLVAGDPAGWQTYKPVPAANSGSITLTNLKAGTYSIQIRYDNSANSCVFPVAQEIKMPTALTLTAKVTKVATCELGATITAEAKNGTPGYQYELRKEDGVTVVAGYTFSNSAVFTDVPVGKYVVVAKDLNECQAAVPAKVEVLPAVKPTLAFGPIPQCFDSKTGLDLTLTIGGGVGPYTYTVAYNGGTPSLPSATFNGPTFTYKAANEGTYEFVVKDSYACETEAKSTIIKAQLLTSTNVTTGLDCDPAPNNQAVISGEIKGGTAPYVVSITSGVTTGTLVQPVANGNTFTYSVATAGNYTFQIKDANNCITTSEAIIAPLNDIILNSSNENPKCNNSKDGTIKLNVSGGAGGFKFSTDGLNYNDISYFTDLSAAVPYTYYVKDNNRCVKSITVTLTAPAAINGTASITTPYTCDNAAIITVGNVVTGGNGIYKYTLNRNGVALVTQDSKVFTGITTAGSYTVTITDSNACTFTTTPALTIAALNGPKAMTINKSALTCPTNKSTFSITDVRDALGAPLTGPFTYSITAPASAVTSNPTGTFANLDPGVTYTFEVKDAKNCSFTKTDKIDPLPVFSISSSVVSDVNCLGDSKGEVTFTVSGLGNNVAYTYQIDALTSQTGTSPNTGTSFTISATNLNAGLHKITVTNNVTKCSVSDTETIAAPAAALSLDPIGIVDVTCKAKGSATINVKGGWGSYSYVVTPTSPAGTALTQSLKTFSNLSAGNYSFVVTDLKGCQVNGTFTIKPEVYPAANINVTSVYCAGGGGATLIATPTSAPQPNPNYEYKINAGNYQPSGTFSGLNPGKYTITVRDILTGCTADLAEETIAVPLSAKLDPLVKDLDCDATNPNAIIKVVISNGYPDYTYRVNTNGGGFSGTPIPVGAGLNTFNYTTTTGSAAATYQFEIFDNKGCRTTVTQNINARVSPTADTTPSNPTCYNGTNGSIEVTASLGLAPYTYEVSTTSGTTGFSTMTSNKLTGVGAGTYWFRVTDAKKCQIVVSRTLTNPAQLTAHADVTIPLKCGAGNATQSATITVTIDSPGTPYTGVNKYRYSYNGQTPVTSNTYTTDKTGTVTVDVYDANNCTFRVLISPDVKALVPPKNMSFDPPAAITCATGMDKTDLTVRVDDGVAPFRFEITNTDAAVAPTAPIATGVTTQDHTFTDLAPGTYYFKVTDANGCTTTGNFKIDNVLPVIVNGSVTSNVNCKGMADGKLSFTVSGNSGTFTYVLRNAANAIIPISQSTQTGNVVDYTSLAAGIYTITITNPTTQCTATKALEVKEATVQFAFSAPTITPITCSPNNGKVVINTVGGWGNNRYTLTLPDNTVVGPQAIATFSNLTQSGTYGISVTDLNGNGCTITTTFNVAAAIQPDASIDLTLSDLCYDAAGKATIVVTPAVTSPTYMYNINDGVYQASGTFSNLNPGSYVVKVKDMSTGCILTLPAQAIETELKFDAKLETLATCNGQDVEIKGTVSGGKTPYTYTVTINGTLDPTVRPVTGTTFTYTDPTATTATVNTTYLFTLSDASTTHCSLTSTVIVAPKTNPDFTLTPNSTILCNGDATGSITVTIDQTKGASPYTINVTKDNSALVPATPNVNYGIQTTGLPAGDYIVRVTDAKGCYKDETTSIIDAPKINFALVDVQIKCVGGTTGTTFGSISVTGLTGGTTNPAPAASGYTYTLTSNTSATQVYHPTGNEDHTFNVLNFGIYELTVSDINGCTLTKKINMASPPEDLKIEVTPGPPSCTTASLIVKATPTIPGGPYYFAKYPLDPTDPTKFDYATYAAFYQTADATSPPALPGDPLLLQSTFNNLNPGVVYSFVVYDDTTKCYYFKQADGPTKSASTLTSDVTAANVTCMGADNGTVSFTIANPQPTTTRVKYEIYNSQTNIIVTPLVGGTVTLPTLTVNNVGPLKPGTYYILFTEEDNLGNIVCLNSSDIFTITQSVVPLSMNATAKNDNCGPAKGVVEAFGKGGTTSIPDPTPTDPNRTISVPYLYQIFADTGAVGVIDGADHSNDPIVEPSFPATFNLNGQTKNTFNVDNGNYIVYVKDANGCIAYSFVEVKLDPSPVISAVTNNICVTEGSFVIDVNLTTTGVGQHYYSLDGAAPVLMPSASFSISNLASGNHTVRVIDFNGCGNTVTLPFISTPLEIKASFTKNPICENNDGEITAEVTGGFTPNNFEYTLVKNSLPTIPNVTQPNDPKFVGLTAGNYTITVRDINTNCTRSIDVDMILPTVIDLLATDISTTPVDCTTGQGTVNNGTLTVNLRAVNDNPNYTYVLTPVSPVGPALTQINNNIFKGLNAGDYTVSVTSARGCEKTVLANVPAPAAVVASADATPFSCVTDPTVTTVVVTALGGTGTYTFSKDGTNYFTSNSTPPDNKYTFEIEDNLAIQNPTYWVKDSNGCLDTSTLTTPLEPLPKLISATATRSTAAGSQIDCVNGREVIQIDVVGGSSTPIDLKYQVSIDGTAYTVLAASSGSRTFTYNAITAGSNYQFKITDNATGCDILSNIYDVPLFDALSVTATTVADVQCKSATNGSIEINVSGYTGPYTYALYDGLTPVVGIGASGSHDTATSNPFTIPFGLGAGTNYTVRIVETAYPRCFTTSTVAIISEPTIALALDPLDVTPLGCTTDGAVKVTTQGGWGNNEYTLTPPSGPAITNTNGNFGGLKLDGLYGVSVKDANGCTVTDSFNLVIPTPPTAVIASTSDYCYDSTDLATLVVTASGGAGGYEYSIDNKQSWTTNNTFTNLTPGIYDIIVKDAYGCEVTASSNEIKPQLFATAQNDKNIFCTGTVDGTIKISAQGGYGSYTYTVNKDNAGASTPIAFPAGLDTAYYTVPALTGAGNYEIVVYDARNCSYTVVDKAVMVDPTPVDLLTSDIAITPVDCNAPQGTNNNGTITVNLRPVNNNPDYTYVLTPTLPAGAAITQVNNNLFTGLTPGQYNISVTSERNCEANVDVMIADPVLVTASATASAFSCAVDPTKTTAVVTAGGGTGTYTFSIDGTNYFVSNSTPADNKYTFELSDTGFTQNPTFYVKDSNGCIQTTQLPAVLDPLPQFVSVIGSFGPAIDCVNKKQEINVVITGGSNSPNAFTYNVYQDGTFLSGPTTVTGNTFTYDALKVGSTYEFEVLDNNTKCSIRSASYEVPVFNIAKVNATVSSHVDCNSNATGAIEIDVIDYNGTYNYEVFSGTNPVAVTSGVGDTATANPFTIPFGFVAGLDYRVVLAQTAYPSCTITSNNVTITEPAALSLAGFTPSVKNQNCQDLKAVITIDPTTIVGGSGNYTFAVVPTTTPPTVPAIGDYKPFTVIEITTAQIAPAFDSYDVYVKDAKGCFDRVTVQIAQDPAPAITNVVATQCPSATNTYDITVTATGFTANLEYSLDGNTWQLNNNILTATRTGSHTVYVRDENKCQVTSTVDILEPLKLLFDITIPPTCTTTNGQVTLTASGGSNNYEYSIDGTTYVASNVFNNLGPGNYTFYVRDLGTPCTKSVDVLIDIPNTAIDFTLTPSKTLCNGASDGTITVNMATPTTTVNNNPVYTYSINPAPVGMVLVGNVFKNLPQGLYTVTVTSGKGCPVSLDATVDQPAIIAVPNAVVVQYVCTAGNKDNYATITVPLPTGGSDDYKVYEFLRDGNAVPVQRGDSNVYTESDLLGHTYVINVYDTNGCLGSTTATINPFVAIDFGTPAVTVTQPITCANDENIQVNVVTTGTTTPMPVLIYHVKGTNAGNTYDQTKNNGTFLQLPIGIYSVTVTNPVTGCILNYIHYVNNPNTFNLITENVKNVACFGTATGSIDLTIVDNEVDPKDDAGIFDYQISGPVMINGRSTGATITIPNLVAGVYTVKAQLVGSPYCEVESTFAIDQPLTALQISETHTVITCDPGNDGTITVSANGGWVGGYQFELVGPVSVPYSDQYFFENLVDGVYTLNVKDFNDCIETTTVTLRNPQPIVVTAQATVADVTCNGDASGEITVDLPTGGQGTNYQYILNYLSVDPVVSSTPQISPVFSGLSAGTYSVTVIDGINCSSQPTADIVINEPAKVRANLSLETGVTCKTNATVTLSAFDGNAPYTYSTDASFSTVLGTFASSVTFSVGFGDHQYYVRDSKGCISDISNNITVTPLAPLDLKIDLSNAVVYCKGSLTAVIDAEAKGGLENYIYTLYDGSGNILKPAQSTGYFDQLPQGTYVVRVDSGDCQYDSAPIVITEPAAELSAIPTVTDATCFGANNGKIEIAATGGTGIIKYAISPNLAQFDDKAVFDRLAPGIYTILVQDENSCFVLIEREIKEPNPLEGKVVGPIIQEICDGDNDGAFTVEVSGGRPPYSISLDNENGTYIPLNNGTRHDFTALKGGTHNVYIKDASCTTMVEVMMDKAVVLNPTAEVTYDCVNNAQANMVVVTVDASNNPTDVDYSLDNNGTYQPSNIFTNVPAGTHFIVARHTNGCEVPTATFDVEGIAEVSLIDITNSTTDINVITVKASGGIAPYEYSFNGEPFSSSNTYRIYKTGDYPVIVRDKNGCEATIIVHGIFYDFCMPNYFTPNGAGSNTTIGPDCGALAYKELTFDIFDRYGRAVAKYRVGQKWDGKYNGNELPTGDYWYVLKLNDPKDNREFVGHFTLYR